MSEEIDHSKPDPGWWQCDGCGADVRPSEAHTVKEPGYDEIVTLAFCSDCTEE